MTTYTYTGRLTDFGETPFLSAVPELWIEPINSAFGQQGPLANKRIPIHLEGNGAFSVSLVASADTSPPTKYRLRLEWIDSDVLVGWTEWEFTAEIGGGTISDGVSAPVSVWWVGPPWPSPLRKGFYFDRNTNDVGRVE